MKRCHVRAARWSQGIRRCSETVPDSRVIYRLSDLDLLSELWIKKKSGLTRLTIRRRSVPTCGAVKFLPAASQPQSSEVLLIIQSPVRGGWKRAPPVRERRVRGERERRARGEHTLTSAQLNTCHGLLWFNNVDRETGRRRRRTRRAA